MILGDLRDLRMDQLDLEDRFSVSGYRDKPKGPPRVRLVEVSILKLDLDDEGHG